MKTKSKLRYLFPALIAAGIAVPATGDETMMKKGHDGVMMKDNGEKKMMMEKADAMTAKVGLDGYCPVCIIDAKKWEKGNPAITSTFDGFTYTFPSKAIQAKFDANPEKYVPVLNGDCIACYEKYGKRVPGSVQHAALRNDRLYLFPGDKEKAVFIADPAAFENSDLAVNGECIVCLAKMDKHVPGTTDYTVIHNGLRYLFPSEKEADMFRQSPQQFVSKVEMMGDKKMMDKVGISDQHTEMQKGAVRLVGRSGCAACEFGVTPIAAPGQLGLAVVGTDGSVTVVEDAHEDYPQIYQDRFQGKQLAVEGEVIKTEGKITWIQPSSVQVIN